MIKIYKYGEVENSEIFSRMADTVDVSDIVTDIIENVKANGDKALYEYCEKFDKAVLSDLLVSQAEIDEADILISKGQGNFETLYGCNLNVYYLFMCKCHLFANRFKKNLYEGMLINDKSV